MKERAKKQLEFSNPNYQYCIQMTDDNNNSFVVIIKFLYRTG